MLSFLVFLITIITVSIDAFTWISDVTCGTTVNGNSPSANPEYYRLVIPVASTITVDNCDSSFDTRLYLVNSTDTDLSSSGYCWPGGGYSGDDCGSCAGSNNEKFTMPVSAGTYYVKIKGFYTNSYGAYQVQVTCTNIYDTSCDDNIVSNIATNGEHAHKLVLISETNIHYETCASAIDPTIRVFDVTGTDISSDIYCIDLGDDGDDCGRDLCVSESGRSDQANGAEYFDMPSMQPGIYYVVMAPWGTSSGGNYEILIDCYTNSPTPAPTDITVSPTAVTVALTSITVSPTSNTPAPTANTAAPTSDTGSPTSDTSAPTAATPGPTSITSSPTTNTQAPTDNTAGPTANTAAPTANTPAPTDNTAGPTANTPAPTANTVSPTANTAGPTAVTVSPTANTVGPTSNTPAPTDNTAGPISVTESPTANTPAPTDNTSGPTAVPTPAPTGHPTRAPNITPVPTEQPTPALTDNPIPALTNQPTPSPTNQPTPSPTSQPSPAPTNIPSPAPTNNPTPAPTVDPTDNASPSPTQSPTDNPVPTPTNNPTPPTTAGRFGAIQTTPSSAAANAFPTNILIIIIAASAGCLLFMCGLFMCFKVRQQRIKTKNKWENDAVNLTDIHCINPTAKSNSVASVAMSIDNVSSPPDANNMANAMCTDNIFSTQNQLPVYLGNIDAMDNKHIVVDKQIVEQTHEDLTEIPMPIQMDDEPVQQNDNTLNENVIIFDEQRPSMLDKLANQEYVTTLNEYGGRLEYDEIDI